MAELLYVVIDCHFFTTVSYLSSQNKMCEIPATMKALVKAERGVGLVLSEVPVPECGPNDVLVKVKKTAICGTDIHIWHWNDWAQKTVPVPLVTGHEFVGRVVKIGERVKDVHLGELVSGEGHVYCTKCRNCLAGRYHLCPNTMGVGVTRSGCFAEYLSIPVANVWHCNPKIPEDILACFDPLGNATHTALSFNMVGQDILISGAGPIGIMASAIAKKVGARYVFITDINPYRLKLAETVGAVDKAININETTLESVREEFGLHEGFDIGLEMSGSSSALNSMIDNMSHGGKIAQLGLIPQNTVVDWNKIIFNGLHIKGIYGRKIFKTWYKMSAMIESGLDITKIITHRFHYTQFKEAFDIMSSGNSGKVILTWSETD